MQLEDLSTGNVDRALRLRNVLLDAAEGRCFNNPEYSNLRREFLSSSIKSKLIPKFIRACRDLGNVVDFFSQHLKMSERPQFVLAQLEPLLKYLREEEAADGDTIFLDTEDGDYITTENGAPIVVERNPKPQRPSAELVPLDEPNVGAVPNDTLESPRTLSEMPDDVVRASAWTGQVSPQEQASIIISLAPAALEGLNALLDEQQRRLHNHPPVAIDEDELRALYDLHDALGRLIAMVERGDRLDEGIRRVAGLRDRVFKFAQETGDLCVAGFRPLLASVPAAIGTWTLLNWICAPATFALLGPAATVAVGAGYFGLDLKRKPTA